MTFSREQLGPVLMWRGDPDSDAAHDAILSWLRDELNVEFRTDALSNRVLGNLGECVAHMLGLAHDFADYFSVVANAVHPLEDVSRSGLDVLWYFPGENGEDEVAVVQEVKTTGEASLDIADTLVGDTEKLFGDDVQKSLQTRLNAAAAEFKLARRRPDLAARLRNLGAADVGSVSKVQLVPSLVHEQMGADPHTKLTAVRTAIVSLGWDADRVVPWSFAMDDLRSRLERISQGQQA